MRAFGETGHSVVLDEHELERLDGRASALAGDGIGAAAHAARRDADLDGLLVVARRLVPAVGRRVLGPRRRDLVAHHVPPHDVANRQRGVGRVAAGHRQALRVAQLILNQLEVHVRLIPLRTHKSSAS